MLKAIRLDIMHYKTEPTGMLTTKRPLAVNFDRHIIFYRPVCCGSCC